MSRYGIASIDGIGAFVKTQGDDEPWTVWVSDEGSDWWHFNTYKTFAEADREATVLRLKVALAKSGRRNKIPDSDGHRDYWEDVEHEMMTGTIFCLTVTRVFITLEVRDWDTK